MRRWIQAVSVFLSASFLFLGRQKKTLLPPGIHVLILCWSGLQALKDQRIRTTTIGHLSTAPKNRFYRLHFLFCGDRTGSSGRWVDREVTPDGC